MQCSNIEFMRNTVGKCVFCSATDRAYPTLCRALRSQEVKYVACGEDHTAVLTRV